MLLCVVSHRGVLSVSKVGWDEGGCTYFRVIIIKTTTNDDIVVIRRSVATSHSVMWHLEPIVVVVAWRESGVVVVCYLHPSWWPSHHAARRWLGLWLVVVVRPLCHVVRLVATLLTATWYLYVLPKQAARGNGGFYSPGPAENPCRLDLSGSVWIGDVALGCRVATPCPPRLILVLVDRHHVASWAVVWWCGGGGRGGDRCWGVDDGG
jgi:hypothetical protein